MLVTPDDFLRLNERVFASQTPLGATYGTTVFEKLVEHIEPNLVVTEPGGAAEWYEFVAQAKAELLAASSFSRRDSPSILGVARIAAKYWKASGTQPQRRLSFVQSADLRRVAEEDWTRLVAAAQREDAKTTAIAAGSVVEAVALDVLESEPTADVLRDRLNDLPQEQRRNLRAKGPPSGWSFAFLLLALGPQGLAVLSESTHDIGHRLREWRNFVHPNEARTVEPLSPADGRIAAGFAEKVLEEVERWRLGGDRHFPA